MVVKDLGLGLAATVISLGLAIATGAGADLLRVCIEVAAVFFLAGLASGGIARACVVVAGGCVPIVALAASGIAFASAPWLEAYLASALIFAVAGAVARLARTRRVALVVPAVAWLGLVLGGRAAVACLVGGAAFERVAQTIEPVAVAGVDGGPLRTGGKIVVIAFWASWCAPCRAELPELAAVAERYRDDPRVAVWWIDVGRDGDTLATAREAARPGALVYGFDRDGIADRFGIDRVPGLVVIDGDTWRLRHLGFDESEGFAASLARELDRLR